MPSDSNENKLPTGPSIVDTIHSDQEAQLVRSRRRRDSNTDQVREVIQAWPESPKKADIVPCEQDLQQNLPGEANVIGSQIPTRDQDWR